MEVWQFFTPLWFSVKSVLAYFGRSKTVFSSILEALNFDVCGNFLLKWSKWQFWGFLKNDQNWFHVKSEWQKNLEIFTLWKTNIFFWSILAQKRKLFFIVSKIVKGCPNYYFPKENGCSSEMVHIWPRLSKTKMCLWQCIWKIVNKQLKNVNKYLKIEKICHFSNTLWLYQNGIKYKLFQSHLFLGNSEWNTLPNRFQLFVYNLKF